MFRIIGLASLLFIFSCRHQEQLVEPSFIDSVITNYTPSAIEKATIGDLDFWHKRLTSQPGDFVGQEKYIQGLLNRFHLYYDVNDLQIADSVLLLLKKKFPDEQSFLLSTAYINLLQHRFTNAKQIIDSAGHMKTKSFAIQMLLFDLNFELGNISYAKTILSSNKNPASYAYNFRLAKLDHFFGDLDSAIQHMLTAAGIATDPYLKQAAISNAADLYVHAGELKKAYQLYKQCLKQNSSDYHSMTKIGWLALVQDNNEPIAKKIFQFVQQKTKSPDALLRLSQASELNDSNTAKRFALQFVKIAGDSLYGDMYNKYLIETYTGILKDPAQAVRIAEKELENRRTPQTYAWLAWSLASNGEIDKAYKVFKENISKKPLEGLELYWMGKLMKLAGKGYNADQFFKAAQKNKYDLSPAMAKDLDQYL